MSYLTKANYTFRAQRGHPRRAPGGPPEAKEEKYGRKKERRERKKSKEPGAAEVLKLRSLSMLLYCLFSFITDWWVRYPDPSSPTTHPKHGTHRGQASPPTTKSSTSTKN
jgi:hypothetical protein